MADFPQWCQPARADQFQQGDVFIDFPMLTPMFEEDGTPALARSRMTCVILTQTCDLDKPSQEWILMGQAFPYGELAARLEYLRATDYKKSLADGNAIADFLIPPISETLPQWMVIHFRNVFSLPKKYVMGSPSDRHELVSPYREHLAQAFARFVMRVGLPNGLQKYRSEIR